MFILIYDYFITNIFTPSGYLSDLELELFGWTLPLNEYLSLISSIISIIFILVLCCLFIYKIIKLVGGLIR